MDVIIAERKTIVAESKYSGHSYLVHIRAEVNDGSYLGVDTKKVKYTRRRIY